jgi:multidrug efflux pump subunit AcrB
VLSPRIGFTLFPASDEGIIQIEIESQVGSKKEILEKYIPEVESVLSSFEEMKVYYITLTGNRLSVYIELTDAKQRQSNRQKTVFEIETEVLKSLTPLQSNGLLVEVATVENGPPG